MTGAPSNYRPWADPPAAAAPKREPTCGDCEHFQRDTVNPGVGMGWCGKGHGSYYPMQQRKNCGDRKVIA